MQLTDLNGHTIKVTDLDKAIEQIEFFKDCHHVPPVESDKERQAYWGDMYKKLLALKEQLKAKKSNDIKIVQR
ncbi:3-isopropylmalate dehydratase [Chryseobacterium shandongense]|uniref:3-isopropylmalate dehydratase n=1 Tax=Chryseobacterium shandongense TaxID=1493872 RepID=A0ABN5RY19_9FLAO|nr:3-isopropylmalate dehydratase [Chryseobacterium shandongense]AZA95627.1 3-isopropylmalate dehydratase [Chryseobacterium shandongense]